MELAINKDGSKVVSVLNLRVWSQLDQRNINVFSCISFLLEFLGLPETAKNKRELQSSIESLFKGFPSEFFLCEEFSVKTSNFEKLEQKVILFTALAMHESIYGSDCIRTAKQGGDLVGVLPVLAEKMKLGFKFSNGKKVPFNRMERIYHAIQNF